MDRIEDGYLNMKVVLTKCDLDGDLEAAQDVVKSMGMSEAIVVSSNEKLGLDKLRNEINALKGMLVESNEEAFEGDESVADENSKDVSK